MRGWLIGMLSVASGVGCWEVVQLLHPGQEPWDVKEYWVAAYPGMIVVSALFGYLAPSLPWRWGFAVLMGQGFWLLLKTSLRSGVPNLWPISLALFAFLSLPCVAAAYLGALLRRRRTA